jgi:nucleoside-diphosphate-sugar epimerase
MQTILGAGGSVGSLLAKELDSFSTDIRLVSRNPQSVNKTDTLYTADLTIPSEVEKSIEGSSIVYSVIGFPYKTKIWQERWPKYITSVVEACAKHKAKLVFFDNIYMYDPDYLDGMNEETPHRPVSKKGRVRKQVVDIITNSVEKGEIEAIIARAPDFISLNNSVITEMVIRNLMNGKKAMWFSKLDVVHNFISMPDAAKATALLGNTKDAYNQTWHLPTDQTRYTGQDWINIIAELTETNPKVSRLSPGMISFIGIFNSFMKEFREMNYQYDRDYFFDSSKFEKKFNYKPETARKAAEEIIKQIKNS